MDLLDKGCMSIKLYCINFKLYRVRHTQLPPLDKSQLDSNKISRSSGVSTSGML